MQITTGLRAILSTPLVYDMLQKIMGASRIRSELVDEFIRPVRGMRILDIGCGTGQILDNLPNYVEYVGFDVSQDYIDAAQKKYGHRASFHLKHIRREDLFNLPKFDMVLIFGVLHHLDDDQAREITSIAYEALNYGGKLITIDPCFVNNQNKIARLLISYDRGQNVRREKDYKNIFDKHYSTVRVIVRNRSWIPYTHIISESIK